MQVNIPVDLEPFVEAEFATGRYGSRAEVLIQALRWLRDERQQAVAGIQQGGSMMLPLAALGRLQMPSPTSGVELELRNPIDLSRCNHQASQLPTVAKDTATVWRYLAYS